MQRSCSPTVTGCLLIKFTLIFLLLQYIVIKIIQFIHYCNTCSKSLELTGAVSLLLPPAWSVTLRGLSGPVLGTGGGDLDCLTADDGGITKFPLLLNSRDLDEIEVRIVFVHVYHHLVKFQNLTEHLQFRTMKISAKVY